MKYLIVDDLALKFSKIAPLRSQLDIRAGILKLRQKIEGYLGIEEVSLIIDRNLENLYKERHPEKTINYLPQGSLCLVNGRIKINEKIADLIEKQERKSILLTPEGDFVSLKLENDEAKGLDSIEFLQTDFKEFKQVETDVELWQSLDQIVLEVGKSIKEDYADFFYDRDNYSETEQGVTIINPYNVWIGEGANLKHGLVIDASEGPVVIDEGAVIGINSTIQGPAYIGKDTIIQASSNMREGVSIGNKCSIGGEIVSSIVQAYAMKPYKGTLNKCYLGEWTKIEAGLSIESDFFQANRITKIRDYSLSFSFNNHTDENICQYQEMRGPKLKNMKIDKNVDFSKIENELLKQYLNEDA